MYCPSLFRLLSHMIYHLLIDLLFTCYCFSYYSSYTHKHVYGKIFCRSIESDWLIEYKTVLFTVSMPSSRK